MIDLDAFILIGGRSTRMGVDKASLELSGQSILTLIANNIRVSAPWVSVKVVAADASQLIGAMLDSVDGFVLDLYPGRGPAGGVYTAAANSEREWIFCVACDLPFISSGLATFLAQQTDNEIDAVVPTQSDGRPQPLAAIYRTKALRDHLSELLASSRPTPSMRSVLEGVKVKYVEFASIKHLKYSEHFFENVNSPNDLARAEAILRNRALPAEN